MTRDKDTVLDKDPIDGGRGAIDLDAALKALANPVRRRILAWLRAPAKEFPRQEHSFELGVCAGKIQERAGLSKSTISAHLAILQGAQLVTVRKVGQWSFYSRNEARIARFQREIQGGI